STAGRRRPPVGTVTGSSSPPSRGTRSGRLGRTLAPDDTPVNGSPAAARRLLERGHHLAREPREVLLHDLLRRPERARDHHVLESRVAALHVIEIADELLVGPTDIVAILVYY